jgi:hypothetical protein
MTTPSAFQGTGLSITIYNPLIQDGAFLYNLSEEINSYSHSISATGGFVSASFSLAGDRNYLEDWLQYGICRHVQVLGPSLQVIWEGYVDQVDIVMGNITSTKGPLTNIANRVSVIYTPIIDETVDPPTTGTTTETTIVEDLTSQEKYGIWERVVSTGNLLDEDAEYARDLFIFENAYPELNTSVTPGGSSGDMSITIQCKGYIEWFNNFIYNELADPGLSVTADTKIEAVILDEPNHVISTSFDKIDINAVLVPGNETENKTAKTVIDEVVVLGGGVDDRWIFGVYAWRKCRYFAASTSLKYFFYTADTVHRVESVTGEVLQPWDVQPGEWVALPDFLFGSSIRSFDIRNDPRVFFVEQVDFTAPDQITLNGKKVKRLSQYLAKFGLGGV